MKLGSEKRAAMPGRRHFDSSKVVGEHWLYFFLLFQFLTQALLVVEFAGNWRIYLRTVAFISSLAMLMVLPPVKARHHPAWTAAIVLLLVTAAGMLHPDTMLLAGFAHWWLTLAIWAPLFWIPHFHKSTHPVERARITLDL